MPVLVLVSLAIGFWLLLKYVLRPIGRKIGDLSIKMFPDRKDPDEVVYTRPDGKPLLY